MKIYLTVVLLLLLTVVGQTQHKTDHQSKIKDLKAEIKALKPHLARQKIAWQSCLLEAYRKARHYKKPVFIWAFLGDPVRGRC